MNTVSAALDKDGIMLYTPDISRIYFTDIPTPGICRWSQSDKDAMNMRLSEKAYALIKEKVVTLELPPSTLIDEQSLMEDLGLGRTPIREALQRLDSEGLVNVIAR
ncbi:MAG: GntR family transcriptional regulator, partial [Armatimonadia bacterium]|nr:GntR family transcriptional regulator [Armatimonadia bacterium]